MTDRVLEVIADFVTAATPDRLPADVVAKATDHLVDSLGCALGGFYSEPARIVSRVVPEVTCLATEWRGGVIGEPGRAATAADAAFLNTVRLRYLDYNDAYPGGHPSDVLGPLLAMSSGAPGPILVNAVVVAYEVFNRLCAAGQLRERGWDQGLGVAWATCAGLGRLLGLPREQLVHALSLATVCNLPMRATRAGRLSMWKGCATAMAARTAVECTLLAQAGMDGPEQPVVGRHGLEELVTGRLDLAPFDTAGGDYWIRRTNLKYWPVEYHLQAAVWAALELRKRVRIEQVEAVHVDTYWSMWHETASEEGKWHPDSRETADHSLPYVFVRALRDGQVDAASFAEEAYRDERVLGQLRKVSAAVDEEIQALFPDDIVLRAAVRLVDGSTQNVEIVNPLGQSRNPLDRRAIEEKFRRLSSAVCDSAGIDRMLEAWWRIGDVDDVADAMATVEVTVRRSDQL